MEFGDASSLEASGCDPPKMDFSNNQRLEAISMLLMNAMEDCLKRGSVMVIAEMFNVACSMIHKLWKWVEHTCSMGVINSPELYSQKKSGRVPQYLPEFIEEGVKSVPLRKRHTQQKLAE